MLKHILLIGIKDLRLAFRDPAALTLMLAAPFLLTLGLGFATGGFGGGSNPGLADIAVGVVNLDDGALGEVLVTVFRSPELDELLALQEITTIQEARRLVDEDQIAAAVIIPAGFSASILPSASSQAVGVAAQIEIYANPNTPTSAGVIQTIVGQFLGRVEMERASAEVAVRQMLESGLFTPQEAAGYAAGIRNSPTESNDRALPIRLEADESGVEGPRFNILAFMAPSMALMFLMYTVTYGGRSILIERQSGTLSRLLVAPIRQAEVLGGKVFGIILTGAAQMFILIVSCTLLFQLEWGDPAGVFVLVLAAVFGAAGWGMLLTALARTPGQVASVGSALMLSFGILGGNFINLENLPAAIQWISKITPNAWGLDGFTTLALGGGLAQLVSPIAALMTMGSVLFGLAAILFNRNAV
jgi:ABC-2 type transport system permease protein